MGFYATAEVKEKNRYYPVFRGNKSENRLIKTESASGVHDEFKVCVENEYDYLGRRFRKTTKDDYSGGAYTTTNVITYIWNGWNIIAEMSDAGYTNYYTCGSQFGEPLCKTSVTSSDTNTYFYLYDGNMNVVQMIDEAGSIVASYEYSPFGDTIKATGPQASSNAFRFGAHYFDTETGIYKARHRDYSPTLGRFLSMDPIDVAGGLNLYAAFANDPIGNVDYWGLAPCKLNVHLNLSKAEIKTHCKTSAGATAPFGCFSGKLLHEEAEGSKAEIVKCGFLWRKRELSIPFTMCEGSIYVRKDAPGITIGHELAHYENYKKWYENYEKVIEKVEGRCVCSTACLNALIKWMKVQVEIHTIETGMADLQNDINDYPKVGAGGQQWADQAKTVLGYIKPTLSIKQQEAALIKQEIQKECAGEKALKGVQF